MLVKGAHGIIKSTRNIRITPLCHYVNVYELLHLIKKHVVSNPCPNVSWYMMLKGPQQFVYLSTWSYRHIHGKSTPRWLVLHVLRSYDISQRLHIRTYTVHTHYMQKTSNIKRTYAKLCATMCQLLRIMCVIHISNSFDWNWPIFNTRV